MIGIVNNLNLNFNDVKGIYKNDNIYKNFEKLNFLFILFITMFEDLKENNQNLENICKFKNLLFKSLDKNLSEKLSEDVNKIEKLIKYNDNLNNIDKSNFNEVKIFISQIKENEFQYNNNLLKIEKQTNLKERCLNLEKGKIVNVEEIKIKNMKLHLRPILKGNRGKGQNMREKNLLKF